MSKLRLLDCHAPMAGAIVLLTLIYVLEVVLSTTSAGQLETSWLDRRRNRETADGRESTALVRRDYNSHLNKKERVMYAEMVELGEVVAERDANGEMRIVVHKPRKAAQTDEVAEYAKETAGRWRVNRRKSRPEADGVLYQMS